MSEKGSEHDFRKLAHLREQLGEKLWDRLLDPANTGKVSSFCAHELGLPWNMKIGDREYVIVNPFCPTEDQITGLTLVERAKQCSANLGSDDGQYLLDHQGEIPGVLRGKAVFIFTNWRGEGAESNIAYVYWNGTKWVLDWNWFYSQFRSHHRLLRRK